ncbi:magnesium ion transporter [Geranomyces variabilis]|uniref:Magnesium ion transporter n=1 Tax=Geranomyces variabilis TaxID=109894 RepID=A0AAD5XLZ8_9FUNG|nr:magnesium ion transporter [Geranomyces variabilis]
MLPPPCRASFARGIRYAPSSPSLLASTRRARRLWTTATSSSASLDRALDQCTAALHRSPHAPRKASKLCVVLASATYPAAGLERLGRAVIDRFAPATLIGLVVESVGHDGDGNAFGHGLSVTLMDAAAPSNNYTSVAADHPHCVGFVIQPEDTRRVKQKAVGRWPDLGRGFARKTDAEAFDLERFTTVSMGGGHVGLPRKLQAIKESSQDTPLLLTFSDREPHQFLETIDASFPSTTKLGLIGTMTPFVTGRPHTLYFNDKVLSGGLVGAAIVSKRIRTTSPQPSFTGLEALGEPLAITSCRGNIILNIDDTNAAKELLARMSNREMTAGVAPEHQLYVKVTDGDTSAVYRLTGGDPSKGTLAVDTVKDLEVGMKIQFMQRVGSEAAAKVEQADQAVVFACSDPDAAVASPPAQAPSVSSKAAITRTIAARSEHGFIYGRGTSNKSINALTGTIACDPDPAAASDTPPAAPPNPLTGSASSAANAASEPSSSAAFIYEDADGLGKLPDPSLSIPGTKKTLKLRAIVFDEKGNMAEPVEGEFSKIGICQHHKLQPRDLRKMDNTYSEQTPIILVREKAILVNLLNFKVLIEADAVILASKVGAENNPYSDMFLNEMSSKLRLSEGNYEFRALETIFLNVMGQLHAEQKTIFLRVNRTLETLDSRIDEPELKSLLIARRKLDEFALKVNAIRASFTAVLNQDDDLAALYLTDKAAGTPRAEADHIEAELLFEHYLNLADELANATSQLSANIAATSDIISIVLGSRRNLLLQYELMANLSMAALAPSTLLAGLLGMNVANGMEHADPTVFWSIFAATFAVSGGLWFASLRKMWKMALASGYKRKGGQGSARGFGMDVKKEVK